MNVKEFKYDKVNAFSKLLIDYSLNKDHFSDLISNYPSIKNFKNQISLKSKNYNNEFRKVIVEEINNQYKDIELSADQKSNISKILDKKTFTVTTGHQLNLFTGPLYFIYKIISVINLSEILKKNYSQYNFVPIYWMATEDHDFEEINNFSFKEKKFQWDTNQKGVVGEFKLDSINNVISDFEEYVMDYKYGSEICLMFKECYLKSKNLAGATRKFVNKIFSKYGLIIIDANNKNLKSLFRDILIKELDEKLIYKQSINSLTKLRALKYNIQANPREINLFYIKNQIRERILLKGHDFYTKNELNKWTLAEIKKEIEIFPERFSPNVLFRPIYQEYILPNICYVGGPAELAYWLELKSVFNYTNLVFPIVLNRNSVMLIDKKTTKNLNNLDTKIEDLFMNEEVLKETLAKKFSHLELDFTNLKNELIKQFEELKKIADKTDKSFIGALNAQEKKQTNGLKMLEKRLIKSEKRIHQDKIARVIEIQKKLFPDGKLQERVLNFSEFYKIYGPNLIDKIKNNLDPLSQKFSVIEI